MHVLAPHASLKVNVISLTQNLPSQMVDKPDGVCSRRAVKLLLREQNIDMGQVGEILGKNERDLQKTLRKRNGEINDLELANLFSPENIWQAILSLLQVSESDTLLMGRYLLSPQVLRIAQECEKLLRACFEDPNAFISIEQQYEFLVAMTHFWASTPSGNFTSKDIVNVVKKIGNWKIKRNVAKSIAKYIESYAKKSNMPLSCSAKIPEEVFSERIDATGSKTSEMLEHEKTSNSFETMTRNFLESEFGGGKIPQITPRTKVEKKSQAISKDKRNMLSQEAQNVFANLFIYAQENWISKKGMAFAYNPYHSVPFLQILINLEKGSN